MPNNFYHENDLKPTRPRYSGNLSRKFWGNIDKINDVILHSKAYGLGVKLQNFEGKILDEINRLILKTREGKK